MQKHKNKASEKEDVQELTINTKLPSFWIDFIDLSVRTDEICLVRLATSLPEGLVEQSRFLTNEDKLKEFIENVCLSLDYYPKRPENETPES